MNGVQTRFKCKLDVKRCKRFVFPPSSLLPRSNALKTKAIRYFQTDRTLTRIVSPPLRFFVEELKWEDKNESLLPELRDERNFVIYANAKGMLIASNVSYCFCDPRNPTYNAEKAAAKDTNYSLIRVPAPLIS